MVFTYLSCWQAETRTQNLETQTYILFNIPKPGLYSTRMLE